jgi:putative ABC transport system permease protein
LPLDSEPELFGAYDLMGKMHSAKWLSVYGWRPVGVTMADVATDVGRLFTASGVLAPDQRVVVFSAAYGNPLKSLAFPAANAVSWVLCAAILLALALNLAILASTRAISQETQIATELALGAGVASIGRRLIAESIVIALPALAVSIVAAKLLAARVLPTIVRHEASASAAALVLDLLVAVVAAFVMWIPSWIYRIRLIGRLSIAHVLTRSDYRVGGLSLRRFRWLLSTQFALGAMLLSVGSLFSKTLDNLVDVDLGFQPSQLYASLVTPKRTGYQLHSEQLQATLRRASVRRGTLLQSLPIGDSAATRTVTTASGVSVTAYASRAGGAAMSTIGATLLAGRDFAASDRVGTQKVAIVNETLARRAWPSINPVGQQFRTEGSIYEVIGVVKDGKYVSISEPTRPFVYFAMDQFQETSSYFIVIRQDNGSDVGGSVLRGVIASELIDCCVVGQLASVQGLVDDWFRPLRTIVVTLRWAALGLLAVVAHGLFCMVIVVLHRSQREVAIRRALGAGTVVAFQVLARWIVAVTGIAALVGSLCAGALGLLLSKLLYGVRPFDALSVAGFAVVFEIILAVLIVALAAAVVVSRREDLGWILK